MSGYALSVSDLGCPRPTDLCLPALHPSTAGKEHHKKQQLLALGQSAIVNLRGTALIGLSHNKKLTVL